MSKVNLVRRSAFETNKPINASASGRRRNGVSAGLPLFLRRSHEVAPADIDVAAEHRAPRHDAEALAAAGPDEVSERRVGDDPATREIGRAFARDMADVELQTGEFGDRVAREAGAPAITMGRRVYFQTGAYQVHTAAGKEMLAHELAHVAQQGGAKMRSVAMPLGARGDAAEREASRAAAAVARGEQPIVSELGGPPVARRWEAGEHALIGDIGFVLGVISSFAANTLKQELSPEELAQIRRAAIAADTQLGSKGQADAARGTGAASKKVALDAFVKMRGISDPIMIAQLKALAGFEFSQESTYIDGSIDGSNRVTPSVLSTETAKYSYGAATGMGGDFAEKPEDLSNIDARSITSIKEGIKDERSATQEQLHKGPNNGASVEFPDNSPKYTTQQDAPFLRLAMKNYAHFGAGMLHQYLVGHSRALALAAQGHLREALQVNAHTDHFLEDAFCSGHIRTPRKEIKNSAKLREQFVPGLRGKQLDLLGKLLHDIDNRRGLWVKCVNKEIPSWRTYGDTELGMSPTTLDVAVQAVTASVREVLDVYARRESFKTMKDPTEGLPKSFAALDYFPVLDWSKHTDESGNDIGNMDMSEIFRRYPELVEQVRQDLPDFYMISQSEVTELQPHLDALYQTAGENMADARPKPGEPGYEVTVVDKIIEGLGKTQDPRPVMRGTPAITAHLMQWSGRTLSFSVGPADCMAVYLKWFDWDSDADYDDTGRPHGSVIDVDPQLGLVTMVPVRSGKARIEATGSADKPGETYAVVFADPDCSGPLVRSDTMPIAGAAADGGVFAGESIATISSGIATIERVVDGTGRRIGIGIGKALVGPVGAALWDEALIISMLSPGGSQAQGDANRRSAIVRILRALYTKTVVGRVYRSVNRIGDLLELLSWWQRTIQEAQVGSFDGVSDELAVIGASHLEAMPLIAFMWALERDDHVGFRDDPNEVAGRRHGPLIVHIQEQMARLAASGADSDVPRAHKPNGGR